MDYLFDRLGNGNDSSLPSRDLALQAFRTLCHRPEEMTKAMRQLRPGSPSGQNPDAYLPVIAATLRAAAADIELARVEQLGCLAGAIFARIASAGEGAKGISSGDATAEYGRVVGREVEAEEIQPMVDDLINADVVVRLRHGVYGVADPSVMEAWRDRQQAPP